MTGTGVSRLSTDHQSAAFQCRCSVITSKEPKKNICLVHIYACVLIDNFIMPKEDY